MKSMEAYKVGDKTSLSSYESCHLKRTTMRNIAKFQCHVTIMCPCNIVGAPEHLFNIFGSKPFDHIN